MKRRITASTLNKLVTLKHKGQEKRDDLGGVLPAEWSVVAKIWANVRYRPVQRRPYMDETINYIPTYFVIREREIKLSDRIRYAGEDYEVLNITKLDGLPQLLEVEARATRGV